MSSHRKASDEEVGDFPRARVREEVGWNEVDEMRDVLSGSSCRNQNESQLRCLESRRMCVPTLHRVHIQTGGTNGRGEGELDEDADEGRGS